MIFFFSSRRRHTRYIGDWSSDVCSSDLHLLIALASEREGIVRPVLGKCGVHPDAVVLEAERMLSSIPRVTGAGAGTLMSPSLNQLFEAAFSEAEKFKDEFVSTEHLLLAISQ